jgi:hypothetical protein
VEINLNDVFVVENYRRAVSRADWPEDKSLSWQFGAGHCVSDLNST